MVYHWQKNRTSDWDMRLRDSQVATQLGANVKVK